MTATAPASAAPPAQIGPNAIIRTVQALREHMGEAPAVAVLAAAGLAPYAACEPTKMVPQSDVTRLFATLRSQLGENEARVISRIAGQKTAEYILAFRIPYTVRSLLCLLPAPLAAPILLASIGKHTWTFAGGGTVRIDRLPCRIAIEDCPVCSGSHGAAPLCTYYAATFEGLFRELVARRTTVTEVACEAQGAAGCLFEIRWT